MKALLQTVRGTKTWILQQMAGNCTANEEVAANVIQKFEEIIKNKKRDIVWLAYHQGKIFQKFKSKERFVNDMVSKFKVSKSAIVLLSLGTSQKTPIYLR